MWASIWAHTVHQAVAGHARLSLDRLVQPRIEPEVVFSLRAPVPAGADAHTVLNATEWIAAGFEIVQSHYPDWKFTDAWPVTSSETWSRNYDALLVLGLTLTLL